MRAAGKAAGTRLPDIAAPSSSMAFASSEHARAKAARAYARAREVALMRAKQRHEARFELLESFTIGVLQHCAWRVSLRAALELPTAFSSTSTRRPYRAQKRALVTAFSTAVILPEHMHIPLAALDDFAKKLYDAYDVECSDDGIDYRQPLMGLAHAATSLTVAVEVYLRAAYRAYDGDGNAGLTMEEVYAVFLSVCASEAETHAVRTLVDARILSLFAPEGVAGAVRTRVDVSSIVRWSEEHEELRTKLQALRVAHSHPSRQEEYRVHLRSTAVVQRMFERDAADPRLLNLAKRQHELHHSRLAFNRLRLHVVRRKAWRERVARFQRRRAIQKLQAYVKPARAWRAKIVLARTVWAANTCAAVMRTWQQIHSVMRLHDAAQRRRAENYWMSRVYDRVLHTWRDRTMEWRAIGAYTRRTLSRTWRAWAKYARDTRHGRVEEDALEAAARARVREAMERLEADARARAEAEHLKVEAHKQALFLEAAAKEAAQLQWQMARAEAAKRSNDRAKAASQAAARRAASHLRRSNALVEFNARWDARISAAMEAARASKRAFLLSPAGLPELDAAQNQVLTAQTLAHATQEESEFVARVDMRDGCIHYTRAGGADVAPMDFNIDNMSYMEAKHVALAHQCARAACVARDALLSERRSETEEFERGAAVNMLIHAFRAQRARAATLASLRERLELCIDPMTGAAYVYDCDTGSTFHHPMRLCRATSLFFMPDWCMRTKEDGSVMYMRLHATARAARAGSPRKAASVLAAEAEEMTSRETPPEEYIMCAACGVDFATRQCHGDECEAYPFCFACFAAYHPRDHATYARHWHASQWSRMYVRPAAQLLPDEAAMLRGKTRRHSVLRLPANLSVRGTEVPVAGR